MSMLCSRSVCVITALLLFTTLPATAQEDTTFSDTGFWFQGGMGVARGSVEDIAYDFGVSLSYKGVWTIRLLSASTHDDYSPDRLESISVMYGLRTHTKHIMGMISAGPSHTRFSTREVSGATIGLVIEEELMIRPIQFIGLGFRMSQNLNFKRVYISGGLFLEFGVLWQ